ncbi:thioester dehydrase [Pseudoalteromonas sp. CnMc7-15]|uniref:ApeI family dehydratase n=1 Tax=unclassified Pseudoalteromonas TaxID=194690 RepID=UPI001EF71451|nr:thioester dehydrase [Pseudoalteromonas sp. CnMc7-15]MCG7565691.1 thioester dehydrase [Pseudoalteromonas sp. CnMc7-15]
MTDFKVTHPDIVGVDEQADEVLLTLSLAPQLDYFKGHFPDAPILAGVVQLDWAIHYGRKYFGYQNAVENVEVLKFQVVMTPGLEVTLALEKKSAKVTFRYYSHKGQHASGRIVFASDA